MMNANSVSGMIKLTSSNYSIRKPRTEDLYDPTEGDKAKPTDKSDKVWTTMFRKTVVTIRQWIDHSVFHHVAKETKADELWKKLEILYERKTAQNKTSLIKRVVNPKLKDGQSVPEHLSDFQGLVRMVC